ncbi:MAG TPA: hypothetical protein PLP29_19590, partial [Candidatus Ozemobacteraceae bacterium]|nr:hypothetical protein [Candidatus Ozemobacteraceae bacterium]
PAPAPAAEPATAKATPSETLIGLPSEEALTKPAESPKPPADPESLISLPGDAPDSPATAAAQAPVVNEAPVVIPAPAESAAEIVVSGTPPAATPPSPQPQGTGLPLFPKDTSSALFMVMKTWECEDYDGRTLLEHAVGVYAKESEDPFTVQGLDALPAFKLTLKESDITLDELLDVVSQKANIDWGVDIAQKVIYLYPAKQQ